MGTLKSCEQHVPKHVREYVDVTPSRDVSRLRAVRASLSALIAGLGALATALQAPSASIGQSEAITALAAAAAAAGAVYGVNPYKNSGRAEMSRQDLIAVQDNTEGPTGP